MRQGASLCPDSVMGKVAGKERDWEHGSDSATCLGFYGRVAICLISGHSPGLWGEEQMKS